MILIKEKEFNVTGVCIPEKHYMVDISNKINEIEDMVDKGKYFVINRPRQYGKTTTLSMLSRRLKDKYLVIRTSFEAVSDVLFENERNFCSKIFNIFADSIRISHKDYSKILKVYQSKISNFDELSIEISNFIEETDQEVVLLIDEVDKNSNNKVFMKFLALLRSKYLFSNEGLDITFKSVILAGVHDIKNLKLVLRDEGESRFNSPWNISADFGVEMCFSSDEIETMLKDYCLSKDLTFDTHLISKQIFEFTSGYPYLVSRICKVIDENLKHSWSYKSIETAIKYILDEKSTLFDDVIKNLENNTDLKDIIIQLLIEGNTLTFNPDVYEKGLMYGLLSREDNHIKVHNKLFETRIYNYLVDGKKTEAVSDKFKKVDRRAYITNGILDMERILLKFQEIMMQEYRKEDEEFYEKQGRLLFLLFLRPIINGVGFYFVEPETRENKRMDIVVTYGDEIFIIELKIWHGENYETKGLKQLKDYMDIQKSENGYLLNFDFRECKEYKHEWLSIDNKRIFEVNV